MKRREFLKKGVTFVGATIVGGSIVSKARQSNGMTIVHKPQNTTIGTLDQWGQFIGISRKPGELDREFRQRVLTKMRSQNVGPIPL